MKETNKCKICNKKTDRLELHHIIPKSRGGDDSESNLIKVCVDCHGLAHDVSFSNGRGGGLLKEAIKKKRKYYEQCRLWLCDEKNGELVENKFWELYNEDEDEHMLMLLLLEKGRLQAYHLKEWVTDGRTVLKTSFTFDK